MSDQEPLETKAPAPPSAPFRESSGEEEAFAAFYRSFLPTLVGFLIWQGAGASLAADLAQESMIKAWRGWSTIRSPRAWVRRVSSRELVRHYSRVEEDPVNPVPDGANANALISRPQELAEWENGQEILGLLESLPPRQRQVLAWSVDGYSPSEIAEELGIDPATVRANLMKARHSVASRMKARREEE
ncbi:RNA polymerase sigma factor [Streptomyces sp. NBC_01022]|uniref:RNA polymerase sigma factor n=1 Tax=Streptomyces sp. NBC_01022 TaxID=2903723 RepID=UPI002DDC57CE|nr:sigma-70 family RNA polymerase sigma factor [Streptomyces sp. NBC_01022]WRZ78772.1 sigma-70 family RNA polymerase sigma factor [Streptomyces sp. NBC_01022]WRZ86907.1 sigma-70 family RNA polymerase sigma factor [Streptomyces sp. NBC_01022]